MTYYTLANYYALLYLVFTKGEAHLGKGLTLIAYDEKPLVDHIVKVFGVDKSVDIQRQVFQFLEQHVEYLQSYHGRARFLEDFESSNRGQIIDELIGLVRYILDSKQTVTPELYSYIDDAILLMERIRYGYSVVNRIAHSVLVRPQSNDEMKILITLSEAGLVIYLLRTEGWYVTEELKQQEHFIVPGIVLWPDFMQRFKEVIKESIKWDHRRLQELVMELGRLLGYESYIEFHLEGVGGPRIDVVWIRNGRVVKAFEIQLSLKRGDILRALHNLERTYRRGAQMYIVVPRNAIDSVQAIIREDMPQLEGKTRILTIDQVTRLYEALRQGNAIVSLLCL